MSEGVITEISSGQDRKGFWTEWAKAKTPTEIGEMLAAKEQEADTDHLSGLPNRRSFEKNLEVFENIHKRENIPVSFLYIDIDNFKGLNDEFGHDAGDHVIAFVSQVIRDAIRTSDTPARLGGDEFAAMLPYTNHENAESLKARMVKIMEDSLNGMDDENLLAAMDISISVGLSTVEENESLKSALEKADKQMYKVKRNSRNGK